MLDYTTDELLNDVKRRASVPVSQNLFDASEMLAFLSNQMIGLLVPRIMSVREDFFVKYEDVDIVSGTTRYGIPRRAIGQKLRDIKLVGSSGAETDIPRLGYKEKDFDYSHLWGYFFEGENIVLYPDEKGFLQEDVRMYYFRRPNRLVRTSDAGKITAIDTGTNEVTLDNAPTSWTASTVFDVIKGQPGFESVQDDQTITNIAGNILTFSSLPSAMAVNDYVAEQGESPIPQIPYEAFSILAELGAVQVMKSLGHMSAMQASQAMLNVLEEGLLTMISPRADGTPKKVVSRKGIWRVGRSRNWHR